MMKLESFICERKCTTLRLDLLLHARHRHDKCAFCSAGAADVWKVDATKKRPDASHTNKKWRGTDLWLADKMAQPPTSQLHGPAGTSNATESPWLPTEYRDTRPLLPQHSSSVPSLEAAPRILSPTSAAISIVFVLVMERSNEESVQCKDTLAHLPRVRELAAGPPSLASTQIAHQLPSGGAVQKPDGVELLMAETIGFGVPPSRGLTSQRRKYTIALRLEIVCQKKWAAQAHLLRP